MIGSKTIQTEWQITNQERTYLRELARKQAEYASLPIMQERRQMWFDLNDGKSGARPPFVIEARTFDRDFMPDSVYRCTSKAGKEIEWQLLSNIRTHEILNDDKVMPDTYSFWPAVEINQLGINIERQVAKDADGIEFGFHYLHPIQDLKRDLAILKPPTFRVDRAKMREKRKFLEELLGDILLVQPRIWILGQASLTNQVVQLMGMEAYFMAMYDCPDEMHQLMARLRDNCLAAMRWAEKEGLLGLNNGNHESFGSSFNFTTRLPAPDWKEGQPVRLRDMWGSANSQETIGVSPAMFHEFCFPYFRDVCEPMGLLYYGCCEPAHPFWDDIRQLPHLKKVSISRWCDQKFMGEALRGTKIVFSRKPDPNFLSVDKKLNEDGWAAHIRETLDATKGVFTEFIYRDVITVHGDLNNPRRAVEIARREIDRFWT
ncbi:MAG: hypothetical protein HZA50_13185 [Planctomycetes bacterium]|nr:hypothetical protein [Planctomycetota bacterium]